MKNNYYIKNFVNFINESSINQITSIEIIFENAPDSIPLKYGLAKTTFDVSRISTVGDLLSELKRIKNRLVKESETSSFTAETKSGVGMDITLPDGSFQAGPDFGVCSTTQEAISEIDSFIREFTRSLQALTDDDIESQPFIVINFD
jgi:hypothetical protein